MSFAIFILAHEATFVCYVLFAVLVAFRGSRSWLGGLLFAAAAATAIWSQTPVLMSYDLGPLWLEPAANSVRDGAWLALCLGLIYPRGGQTLLWRALLAVTGVLLALQLSLDVAHTDLGVLAGVHVDSALLRLAATVLGLVLLENIFRNCSGAEFWALKHLLIGLLCILAFQLLSRVPEFLTHSEDPELAIVKPIVFLLALPLFVVSSIRFPNLQVRLHSSRAFVFHSATLIAAGILLQGVAIAAFYVRVYGGSNGTVLAVILLFAGAVAIAVALVSGSIRARVRRFINENFFSLKYDYRVEWERVTRALALYPEQGSAERVLRTLCDLLDTSGGALWIYRASWHQFLPAAKLGFEHEFVPIAQQDPRLAPFLESETSLLNISSDFSAVAWRAKFANYWIVVPLRYRSTVVGVAILAKSRAPKKLDWEDENLLRLVGLQLGAYLIQEETAQSLADARQLEEFNKRFAFIVHDIKNTIGQLSLLVQNTTQFGHKQEFRDDMVVTLRNAVERLQALLKSLTLVGSENVPGSRPSEVIDLVDFLTKFTKEKSSLGQPVTVNTKYPSLGLKLLDVSSLRAVLEHVVTNALEATGSNKPVEIYLTAGAQAAEIRVRDHGPGMSEKFINEELFRPMRTTKDGGFGIGAYQARELMRDLGGDIVVTSKVGSGTEVILMLPRIEPQDPAGE